MGIAAGIGYAAIIGGGVGPAVEAASAARGLVLETVGTGPGAVKGTGDIVELVTGHAAGATHDGTSLASSVTVGTLPPVAITANGTAEADHFPCRFELAYTATDEARNTQSIVVKCIAVTA